MNNALLYTLDGANNPVPCSDILAWGQWMTETEARRQVALTKLEDGSTVSTAFLGINHSHRAAPPVLWETLVFSSTHKVKRQRRYSSWEMAERGHKEMLDLLERKL